MVKFMPENPWNFSPRPSYRRQSGRSLAGFALVCALIGCGEGPKAEFGWRQSTEELIPAANKAVKQVMTDNFGTPNDLVAWERMPVHYNRVPAADGSFGEQMKSGRVVYMKNCMHCHGVAGDGNGPTAKYLNPRPRDFRLGILKFTSTTPKDRASREDILRTVTHGIPGTYMPSFLLMIEDEKTAVVEYVRWLAMRGEMEKSLGTELAAFNSPTVLTAAKGDGSAEQALAEALKSFQTYLAEDFAGMIDQTADFIAETWKPADEQESLVTPQLARVADTAESRQRGRLLYLDKDTKCYTCHGPLGRGDGGSTEDFWKNEATGKMFEKRGLHDSWGNPLKPRDLTKGQYRGGRRPVDLYRRIRAGIKGTPMPAFAKMKDEEIWDLVNYVMSIPYESASPTPAKPAAMAVHEPDHGR